MSEPRLEDLTPDDDGGPPHAVDVAVLDRTRWSYESPVKRLLALELRVRCNDDALGRFLEAFLASYPLGRPGAPHSSLDVACVGDHWIAYLNGLRTSSGETREAMARTLVWDLNVAALAAPTDRVHLHAAVAGREGGAVVVAGESGAGKSTLVTAMAAAGWWYLTDEVADLGADGDVRPYPRPIALDPGSWPLLGEVAERWPEGVPRLVEDIRLVLPAMVGLALPVASLPVRAIVFPEVRPGAPTTLEPMHRAEALERLVPLALNLPALGAAGFERLASIVAAASCHRLVLDGVREAVDLVADIP